MAGLFRNQKTGVRILFGVIIVFLAASMLLYLVPQGSNVAENRADIVARVGDQVITLSDVSQQLNQIRQHNPIPRQLEGLYATQILKQLVAQKEIEYEAKRLGITVSDQERASRIRQYLPSAFNGETFIGNEAYARLVEERFQLTVPIFEELVRNGLVEEKFRRLLTDGISVLPSEVQEEFRFENEKIKLNYAAARPEDLTAKIEPTDQEITAYFNQNQSSFQIPEKRSVRYALLDLGQLRQNTAVTDDELRVVYQQNIQQYQIPTRVHAEHILLTTVGKTDAEVAEIQKKAGEILAEDKKKGANFEDQAKKYSEDPGSKAKGGDLGWIVQGQTVPQFERAAFSLQKGEISDLIRTQYGFHIIKVLDKESAHTQSFDEVKDSLRTPYLLQKVDQEAASTADQLSRDIRQSHKTTLDELAQKYHLSIAETRPVAPNDPVLELGNSSEVKEEIVHLRQGELSLPIRTDRGYVVLSLKETIPAHPGTLAEVREKIVTQLKQQKAAQLAQSKVQELGQRVKAGEKFDSAAKALGLEAKLTDLFARNGSIPGLGSVKPLTSAFSLKVGDLGGPIQMGGGWVVYQLVEKAEPNPADFDKQKASLTDSLLQTKRNLAYEAFRDSLDERLKQEGKVKISPEKLRVMGSAG